MDDDAGATQGDAMRGAALALTIAGLLTVIGSDGTWAHCSTTPCDGILLSFSDMNGLDAGSGVAAAVAGILLVLIGVDALSRNRATRWATLATGLALLVLILAGAFVIQNYILADGSADGALHTSGPPGFGVVLVGLGGFIAFVASRRLRRAWVAPA